MQAFESKIIKPLTSFMTQQQSDWLQKMVEKQDLDHEELATFLTGKSKDNFVYPEQSYGVLPKQSVSPPDFPLLLLPAS